MYADGLSRCKSFHPVYIPLQYIDPTRDLISEIEKYVRESTLRDAVQELHNCSNVVFILDAFDELAQATRDRMGDFFRRLERFTSDQLYLGAATIATGRHTLFSRGDALIPAGTHVITLQPFDEGQINEWSARWNKLARQSFDGTKFWQADENKRGDLHDIATQPLLLYLLAKLEQSGTPVNPADVDTSRSGIYRHIIQWVCGRQQEKRGLQPETHMSSGQMRKLLRLTGFCAMSRGRRAVHLDDLQSMLRDAGLSEETVQDKNNYQAERTFLTFAFAKAGQASWEFKHKQFGEYLAAEYIGERFNTAITRVPDADEPGQMRWSMSHETLARLWIDVFARNSVSPEVQSLLEPMLGCWPEFLAGEAIVPAAQRANLGLLMERCGHMYARLVREQDMKLVAEAASGAGYAPTRAMSNALISSLAIGSTCARMLSVEGSPAYFNIEKYEWSGWWKAITLLRCYEELGVELTGRILSGVSLDSDLGISFPSSYYPGVFLPFVRITRFAKRPELGRGRRFNLPGSLFFGANLSGVDLGEYVLNGANFNRANLAGANLERTQARGAEFMGADLSGANLRAARLCGASFDGASFVGADLHEADFSGANVEGAQFKGAVDIQTANFEGAKIKGSLVEEFQENISASSEQAAGASLTPSMLAELLKIELVFENDVKNLLNKGMLIEAQALTRRRFTKDAKNKGFLESYIGVLLLFNDTERAEIAWRTLSKGGLTNVRIYIQLALTFWKHGEIQRAIEVGEEGLAIARQNDSLEAENLVKNSLAYFYADTDKEEYEGLARRYSEEAYNAESETVSRMDTLGYVKISYGKDEKEVTEGIHLCMRAYMADSRFPELYQRHLNKGFARIEKFNRL